LSVAVRVASARGERLALFAAAGGYFCLLCGYYMLRPIREAMALEVGRASFPNLFGTVFLLSIVVLPLYWWLVARVSRRWLLTLVYVPFAAIFLTLALAWTRSPGDRNVAMVYFVAFSSTNLLVISLFWSSMADVWRPDASKRLYGFVAAGGSLGAIIGPFFVGRFVTQLGIAPFIVVACSLLAGTILLVGYARSVLAVAAPVAVPSSDQRVGGRAIDDIRRFVRSPYLLGIAAVVVAGQVIGGFMYAEQARYVEQAYSSVEERAALFSRLESFVNILALIFQAGVVWWLSGRKGLRFALPALPILLGVSLIVLAVFPAGAVLLVTQVIRRAADYGLGKPLREMLFTVLNPESKFKTKSLIDTVLQRGSDGAAQQAYPLIAGIGVTQVAIVCAVICAILLPVTRLLGTAFERDAK
jgi:AAA family ATP:ADP antiporter